ncbi:3'-5' exonuclease [Actinacidiphila oryziradicis]|uniref:3'-5' exonuclease n=1 Tax=Actinacidiphila oryziradicis TaxID=2571141 RepID=UPI002245AD8F|nr:3'-5' exonuclease [Actinacidiphila oryziradicis]
MHDTPATASREPSCSTSPLSILQSRRPQESQAQGDHLLRLGYLTRNPSADLRDTHFAAVDVETTGFNPSSDRIVEIGVTRITGGGTVLGSASTLVRPERPIPPDASRVHGIYSTDVADAPTFEEVTPDLLRLLEHAVVVTHNLVFDGAFITNALRRAGVSVPALPALCTQVTALSQLMDTRVKLATLTTLMLRRRLGKAAHSAAVDARCTAALLHQFLNNAPEPLGYVGDTPERPAGWAFPVPSSFKPGMDRQPKWPDSWWEQGNSGAIPRWHDHWQGHETPAQQTLEWREAATTVGIEVIVPAVEEQSRQEVLTRRSGRVQSMGKLSDYAPELRERMTERTLAKLRNFSRLTPQRQTQLREAFVARLAVNGGDLAEAFDNVKDEAAERELCPRDAKMHRIGSPCSTLNWADSDLLDYLRERLEDQEAYHSMDEDAAYRWREVRRIPHPGATELGDSSVPWDHHRTVIKAAIAACEARMASNNGAAKSGK